MNNVFNSLKENIQRVLLNLLVNNQLSINRLILIDYISLYGKDFGVSEININGDGPYNLTEYVTKRTQLKEAVNYLVRNGFVHAEINNKKFVFRLSDKGLEYCNSFKSDYAIDYIDQVTITKEFFLTYSDDKIQKFVEEKTFSHRFEV